LTVGLFSHVNSLCVSIGARVSLLNFSLRVHAPVRLGQHFSNECFCFQPVSNGFGGRTPAAVRAGRNTA
jgi:hypothetical protein